MTIQANGAKTLLLKAKMEMDDLNKFKQEHQKAFRIAFDMLGGNCFPPMRDAEYFLAVVKLAEKRVADNPENRLLPFLMIAIIDYLDSLSKDLPETDE